MSRWPSVQLRHIAKLAYGAPLPVEAREPGSVPVYGSNGRTGEHSRANTKGPVIVIGRKGSQGKLQISDHPVFAIDTTYFIDDRFTRANLKWLFYAMSTLPLPLLTEDVGVPGLSRSTAYDQRLFMPPPSEQAAVANFLDAETDRIDALIDKRTLTLVALDARRQATYFAGVSGHLTTLDRPQIAANIPWLPSMPESWPTALLKLLATLGSGHTPSRGHPEWWTPVECVIPWITTGEVAQVRLDRIEEITGTRERISAAGLANSAAELHPAGTVVLSRTASVGFSAIMGTAMATSQDFATWTCGPLLRPRFLLLCLRAMRRDLLGRLAIGSTHKTIYMPDIESIRVPVPPVTEQDQIVSAVAERLAAIDRSADTFGRQIGLLRERRQALITAAVTGEIDVTRGAA